jgi:hypothetical protein
MKKVILLSVIVLSSLLMAQESNVSEVSPPVEENTMAIEQSSYDSEAIMAERAELEENMSNEEEQTVYEDDETVEDNSDTTEEESVPEEIVEEEPVYEE